MPLFTTLTATIAAPAESTTNSENEDVLEIKAIHTGCNPGIPVILQVPTSATSADFLKQLADLTKEKQSVRVLVSGVLETVNAVRDENTKEIIKKPKLICHVGGARRIRLDTSIDPDQCLVFGNGFCRPQTENRNSSVRKPQLFISQSVQSLKNSGESTDGIVISGDKKHDTEKLTLTIEDGTEVYFMGHLKRIEGEYKGNVYDKFKTTALFLQDTDRIRSKRAAAAPSMVAQLTSSFDEPEPDEKPMSAEDLCNQTSVAMSDF